MTTKDLTQCSQCGSVDSVDIRYAACVATSRFFQSDYPAPTTTTVITKDDIQIWKIGLCNACLPKGYRNYLRIHIKKIATQLGILAFLFIVSGLAMYFQVLKPDSNFLMAPFRLVLAVVVAAAFAAGVIGIPICIVMLIIDSINLNNLARRGIVPEKQTNKAFIGEGQRIIKVNVPGKNKPQGSIWGAFPLPKHKPLDEIASKRFNQEKQHAPKPGDMGEHQKAIVEVGKTIEEVENKLPPEWKDVLNQKNKPHDIEINTDPLPLFENSYIVQKAEGEQKKHESSQDPKIAVENRQLAKNHFDLSYKHWEKSRYDEALAECKTAIDLAPSWSNAHNLCGVILEEKGQLKNAALEFQEAIRLDPANNQAKDNLAEVMKDIK